MELRRRMAGPLGGLWERRMPRVAAGPAAGLRVSRLGASADYALGSNELPVQVALLDLLQPGATFLDIGANVGFFSLLAARASGPAGRTYAVEPVPENADRIRAGARRNRLAVDVLELALTDREGTTTLQLAQHPGGATVASVAAPPDPSGTIDVGTDTVDHLVACGRIRPPSVVKIDVEGAEAEVLAGMPETLAGHRPIVLCEVDGEDAEQLRRKRSELVAVLERNDYEIESLAPSYEGSEWLVEHFVARPVSR